MLPLVLSLFVTVASFEPSLPVYDIDKLCKAQPGAMEPGYLDACVRTEKESLRTLTSEWNFLTLDQKRFCVDIGEKSEVAKYTTMVSYAGIFNDLNRQNKADTALRK